jgi:hypothetical protein
LGEFKGVGELRYAKVKYFFRHNIQLESEYNEDDMELDDAVELSEYTVTSKTVSMFVCFIKIAI